MEIETVQVKVLFFAKARELAGINEINVEVPCKIHCKDLLQLICTTFELNDIKDIIILAKNSDYCEDPSALLTLTKGDELAVIPPLSGG